MFIAYIHVYKTPVIKIIHHTINITSTKAELFAIRYGLNQATQLTNIECIMVITDSIHAAKKYLTPLSICIRFRSLRNLGSFLEEISTILLNSGTAQAKKSDFYMIQLTKKQKLNSYLSSHVNLHGILVKRTNMMKSVILGE